MKVYVHSSADDTERKRRQSDCSGNGPKDLEQNESRWMNMKRLVAEEKHDQMTAHSANQPMSTAAGWAEPIWPFTSKMTIEDKPPNCSFGVFMMEPEAGAVIDFGLQPPRGMMYRCLYPSQAQAHGDMNKTREWQVSNIIE
ncbi:hypothetical protein llap_19434 [Limosa lapponica baueri]|uniref:Uncharacterized protein n=1 Tax=Limosa lapponica baueri TaxID=1758121 RepID=A0A2I0T925_LIMLA|nr:hypothetical protein llap_19434 [Limosa lapponica baueri]